MKEERKVSFIEDMSTLEMITFMNEEDQKIAHAIKAVLPAIARLIDVIFHSFQSGGRLIYIGAGTSGRMGVLDASECPPTFGTSPKMVQAIMAGGEQAIRLAIEGAEDDKEQGSVDLAAIQLSRHDVVVGIAASGTTPYVIGALQFAQQMGATTASLTCKREAELSQYADHPIEIITGPEVVAGSTRLKAATAQKMALNMLSTASMVKLGKVYQNQMIDLQAKNEKLKKRAKNIVIELTGVSEEYAETILQETNDHVKTALVMILADVPYQTAIQGLQQTNGYLKQAIEWAADHKLSP